mgnify:FL=1|jgi:hypothetical protein
MSAGAGNVVVLLDDVGFGHPAINSETLDIGRDIGNEVGDDYTVLFASKRLTTLTR